MKLIYFEISDDNKIYNLETCEPINYQISEERYLKFKISTLSLIHI